MLFLYMEFSQKPYWPGNGTRLSGILLLPLFEKLWDQGLDYCLYGLQPELQVRNLHGQLLHSSLSTGHAGMDLLPRPHISQSG
jgi:hypothetical protein